jgi:hypothetical protein
VARTIGSLRNSRRKRRSLLAPTTGGSGPSTSAGAPRSGSASTVLLLASDRAANITGTDVAIDGGLITTL